MQNTPTNPLAELAVWHLTDSALPTGGFAHSAGLEIYIQSEEVHDPETYGSWLAGYLRQSSYNDALALRLAYQLHSSGQPLDEATESLRELDQLVHACQTPKQVRASMNSMGKRMSKVAKIVDDQDPLVVAYEQGIASRTMHGNPGIAAGLVFSASGVAEETAVMAYIMQLANSMTQNATRAIPLGQDAGQRVLVQTYPVIKQAAEMTMQHTLADLGAVAPRLEIAQMQHESLRSRMFMS